MIIVCFFLSNSQDFDGYKKQLLYSQFFHLIKQNNESFKGTFLTVSIEYYRTGLQMKNGYSEELKIVC